MIRQEMTIIRMTIQSTHATPPHNTPPPCPPRPPQQNEAAVGRDLEPLTPPRPPHVTHAQALAERLASSMAADHPIALQATSIRLACRAYLRTYSDLAVGRITDPVIPSTRWWSDHNVDGLLGATVTDKKTFMMNAYTWVTLLPPPDQSPTLRLAIDAVETSTSRARVVLLLSDNPESRRTLACIHSKRRREGSSRTRHHILATYGPGQVHLFPTITPHPESAPTQNEGPLMLVVIETSDMPDTNVEGLAWALQHTHSFSPPPWDTGHPPGDTEPPPITHPSPSKTGSPP